MRPKGTRKKQFRWERDGEEMKTEKRILIRRGDSRVRDTKRQEWGNSGGFAAKCEYMPSAVFLPQESIITYTHTHTHTSFSNCVMRLQFLFLQLNSQIIKLDFKFKIVCMLPF